MTALPNLHADFETRSAIDIKKCGADYYARHLSTDAWCMAYAFDYPDGTEGPVKLWRRGEVLPMEVYDHVEAGGTVIAHNAAFEVLIWNYIMAVRYLWPPLLIEQVVCTMARGYAMALPGSLENIAPALGIDAAKDMVGSRVMQQLAKPRKIDENCPYCAGEGIAYEDAARKLHPHQCRCLVWWTPEDVPEKFEQLYAYCAQDVNVERQVGKRILDLSPFEKDVWILDQKINGRGIYVDVKAAKVAIEIARAEKARLDQEMRDLTNNYVGTCNSTKHLGEWMAYQGVDAEGVAKGDVVELLARPGLPDNIRRALLLRQEAAKASTAKLEPMVRSACEDGRVRGLFQYHGAATGRWAGRRIQPHNFPRPSLLKQHQINEVFGILGGVK